MTQVFKLQNSGGTVDFLTGNIEWRMAGWETTTAKDRVWESIALVSTATDTNIRAEQAKIDDLLEDAEAYDADNTRSDPTWFYWQSEGESAKRSLVYGGESSLQTEQIVSPMLGAGGAFLGLALQRHPAWENDGGTAIVAGTAISGTGGAVVLSSYTGTLPGRISAAAVEPSVYASGFQRLWMGLRDPNNGYSGFIANWPMSAAIAIVNGGTVTGGELVVNFVPTPTLMKRATIYWSGVQTVSNWSHIIGKYLVLARVKVDAASTQARIELRHGWGGNSGHETVVGSTYIDGNTKYRLIELGTVDIPPTGNRDGVATTSDNIKNYAMSIYAERASAGGTLTIERLILIPAEHLVTCKDVTAVADGNAQFYTAPDDGQYAVNEIDGSNLWGNIEYSFQDWEYPIGGALLVVAADLAMTSGADHNTSWNMRVDLTVFPRWRTFRTT